MVESRETSADPVFGRAVVVGVTRDHAEVWTLEPHQNEAIASVRRDDDEEMHRHVKPAQGKHGHDSDKGFDRYFEELASALNAASEVMLAGHGKGRANAMENFAEFLQTRHPSLFARVTELRYVDITRINGRQLAALGREWKNEQVVKGRG